MEQSKLIAALNKKETYMVDKNRIRKTIKQTRCEKSVGAVRGAVAAGRMGRKKQA